MVCQGCTEGTISMGITESAGWFVKAAQKVQQWEYQKRFDVLAQLHRRHNINGNM